MSSYGKKGGEGPTRGRKATTYIVTLPDGSVQKKRAFYEMEEPTGYAYQVDGRWQVAGIADADAEHMQHYTKCNAEPSS